MLPKLSFAALLFWSTALSAQTPAADTTIAGQTLPLLPIETLIAQLQRPANGPAVVHRQVAFRGRLFAPTSGLDTLRVPLDLEEVYFLDEVSFSQVAFLAPVRLERAHFAGGLSFAEAHFIDDFALRTSHLAKHATFQKTHFLGDTDLTASRFAGIASFVGAHFVGQRIHFAQTQFDNAAYFEQAAFAAPATFTAAAFAGIASFKETTWAQPISFAGIRFADRALFWDARFAEEVSFDSGRAAGEVAFDRARFSGKASFADFTFARFRLHALPFRRSPAHSRQLHHLQPLHLHPPQLPRLGRDGQAQTPRYRRGPARLGLLRPAHRRSVGPHAAIWLFPPYCWRSATSTPPPCPVLALAFFEHYRRPLPGRIAGIHYGLGQRFD